ncbi:MAG TPA: L-threonylcarbamoyladenylate synthase [Spirochaetota bacterium]|nr:L-threonylcarbamoyladenylate synthase [Spirochaetota bacterium]HPS85488.1 L-threonylcarbamoyladenylate synthase [Spirochaetota bacterium]
MKIVKATEDNIKISAEIIKNGGLVAFPTETVYGLGADAMNPVAAASIFEAKKRPFFDPLIVHIAELSEVERVARNVEPKSLKLMERFWPGPLTIVLEKKDIVPDIVTSGFATVAVRMPVHPAARELIRVAGTPIAAPSANRFGCLSPTTAEHVYDQLGDAVDIILDGGPCSIGIESTIIKLLNNRIYLLRPGGTAPEEIEEFTGETLLTEHPKDKPEVPGQLPYHYSPEKQVILLDKITHIEDRCGYLFFRKPDISFPVEFSGILSEKGDLREAAANLFSNLHRLDTLDIDRIYAERVDGSGLGIAIMDRLKKASMKYL